MTWVDLVLLVLIAIMAYGGYRRGLVPEIFDLLVIGIGAGVALRFFGDFASWLGPTFGMQSLMAHWLAFLAIFIPVATMILALGLRLDQMSEDDKTIPLPVKAGLGAILGALKGIVLAWLVLVSLHQLHILDKADREAMRQAPVVQGVLGLQPTFVAFAESVTPPRVSKWLVPVMDVKF